MTILKVIQGILFFVQMIETYGPRMRNVIEKVRDALSDGEITSGEILEIGLALLEAGADEVEKKSADKHGVL